MGISFSSAYCSSRRYLLAIVMAGLVPAIHDFLAADAVKTWMLGIADKFTQSAQGRLLRPGMTKEKRQSGPARIAGMAT
ncbi:hypothetical protein DB459_01985 [Bradyrhizobium sp. WD16]|nr:hypothetical protein DB459_01985 [Bradyrhizobium sp. WD16]